MSAKARLVFMRKANRSKSGSEAVDEVGKIGAF